MIAAPHERLIALPGPLDLPATLFVVASKSGGTAGLVCRFIAVLMCVARRRG